MTNPILSSKRLIKKSGQWVDDETYIFCSGECLDAFIKSIDTKNDSVLYDFYTASLCPAFYDCERLDNLREKCIYWEEIEDDSPPSNPFSIGISLAKLKPINMQCGSGDVALIKSSIKLIDCINDFDEKMRTINVGILDNSNASLEANREILKNTEESAKLNEKMYDNTIESGKLNIEMLEQTVYLKWYTIALIILTLINVGLLVYQIFFSGK